MSKPIIDLPLRSWYNDGSNDETENKGTLGGAMIRGDGSTASTQPTQLSPHGNSFDAGDYLKAQNTAVGNYTDDFTMVALVRWNTATSCAIMSRHNGSNYQYDWYINSSGNLVLYNGSNVTSTGAITLDKLYFVACVVKGGEVYHYINDELVVTPAALAITEYSDGVFAVGTRNAFSPGDGFRGNIYKPRVYGEPLTPSQLRKLRHDLIASLNI